MIDFRDEIVGYSNNSLIYNKLKALNLKSGIENISENMIICYRELIDCGLIGAEEMDLLKRWISDLGDYCK